MSTKYRYIIYTDGGCAPNPGPGGCACVITNTETGEYIEKYRGETDTTNNIMEISAIMLALEELKSYTGKILIYSDSEYAIKCCQRVWKRKMHLELWKQIDALMKNKKVDFEWVRGHTGIAGNERCDELVGIAINEIKTLGFSEHRDVGATDKTTAKSPSTTLPKSSFVTAMTAKIVVPAEMKRGLGIHIPKESRYVQLQCDDAIQEINENGASLAGLKKLKSYGLDGWSSFTAYDVKEEFSQIEIDFVKKYLKTLEDCMNAFRWMGRGLKPEYAIRKAMVDAEERKKYNDNNVQIAIEI